MAALVVQAWMMEVALQLQLQAQTRFGKELPDNLAERLNRCTPCSVNGASQFICQCKRGKEGLYLTKPTDKTSTFVADTPNSHYVELTF